MKNRRNWRALFAALLCAALFCGVFSALAEAEIALDDAVVANDVAIGDVDLEVAEGLEPVADLPEPVLNDGLSLDGDLLVAEPEGIALPADVRANEDASEAESADTGDKVHLTVSYKGPTLSKVYDCLAGTAYKDSTGAIIETLGDWSTLRTYFKITLTDPAQSLVEGHTSVAVSRTAYPRFKKDGVDCPDVGSYTLDYTFAITGDDASYYVLDTTTVQVPATITPREVVITPRADLYKYYGDADPVYPAGTPFTLKTTAGTEVVRQDVGGVVTYGVPKFTSDDLETLKYLIRDAQLNERDFFPGFLSRKAGEKAGKYRITIGTLDFGSNFKVTLAKEYFTIKPRPITDSTVTVKDIADKTYTGKALKPTPVVRFNGKKLKLNTAYTLKYAKNKALGTATVTITGKGNFTGTRKLTFRILLKPTAISKLTPGKGQVTVAWKKGSLNKGYEISYALDSDFTAATTRTVKGIGKTKLTLKNLQSKKYYYFRIRTYRTVKGTTYYSAWSKTKKVKIK